MSADAAVLVFAKAPLPGRAKTRLVPKLGAWGAARLQARLIDRALHTAVRSRCGTVELHCTPRIGHPFFLRERNKLKLDLKRQSGRDLGERMPRAIGAALRRHRYAIVIGVDAPELRAADLRRALRLLRSGCDVALAPAEDGGYALIACRRAPRPLFEHVAWGGSTVYSTTVRRLEALRLQWRALRTVWDIDRPADIERLSQRPLFLTRRAR
jgi:rSAM/selenodomain-associated transferase 1